MKTSYVLGILGAYIVCITLIFIYGITQQNWTGQSKSILFDTSAMPTQFPECASVDTIMTAARTILNASWLPVSPDIEITIPAVNGILCENPERMANMMIVASPSPYSTFYFTRSHVHFLADGTPTSPTSLSKKDWTPTKHADGWKADWCELIRLTYTSEYHLWNCPQINE